MRVPKCFSALGNVWNKWYKYFVYYGGRGGGKSESVCRILLALCMDKRLRVLCCRELQKSISDSIYKLLCEIIVAEGLEGFYRIEAEKIVGLNGSEFIFKGLKSNASSLKSMAHIDVCYVEEAENISNKSWEALIPTIRQMRSFFVIIFNPRYPSDPTYKRFVMGADKDMYVKKVGWQDNPFFPHVLEVERVRLQRNDPKAYSHVWEGNFDERYSGTVYAEWVNKCFQGNRVIDGLYDDTLPVYTAWDLGYDDTTAIWFWQKAGEEIRLIDYYENSMQDIEHYCRIVMDRGYKYGDHGHFVPHDAANKLLAAGGRSIVQQAYGFGIKMRVVAATSQQNQIEAARRLLYNCWFDRALCKQGMESLVEYRFEYDDEKMTFKSKPLHNWASHGADAFEIIGQVMRNDVLLDTKQVKSMRTLETMTADELFWGGSNNDVGAYKI